ncbi:hypothetical protein V6N11_002080 [Hibiscus sabdariffa]|uniref:Uncharacterized protein n=1 Tax=Hibiscus sabdariffa TaxID=183260 RepID=A0ABR2QUA3_9ROSI
MVKYGMGRYLLPRPLHPLPSIFVVAMGLEQPSLSMEFMDVEIKQWVRENLKKGVKYGRDSRNWDIMFGALAALGTTCSNRIVSGGSQS